MRTGSTRRGRHQWGIYALAVFATAMAVLYFVLPPHLTWGMAPEAYLPLTVYGGLLLLTLLLLGSLRRSHKNLLQSERKFRNVFEKSGDAMLISKAGIHVTMNPAYLQLFGYDHADQLQGKSVLGLIAEEQREFVRNRIQRRSRGEPVPAHYESLGLRRDGTIFNMEIDVTNFKLDDHQYHVVIVRDITARKHAEQEAKSLNEELERQVARRTAQLEAANRELEAFSFSVSHDLRAPLRGIEGYARIIQEDYTGLLPAEALQLFHLIGSNARKMDQLIADLLAFSRLTRTEPKKVPVDMKALVQAVGKELADLEQGRPVKIAVQNLPPAQGDPALLRQVFANLIGNAIKFTRRTPEPHIEISGHTEESELHYQVQDNGVGFDMKYAEKLYKVFQRLHGAEDFEGTGVGLAIVQRIVHWHGGRVWAEGTANAGACFHFTLPRQD